MADDDDVDFEGASPAYRRALGWVVALNLGYGAAEAVGGLLAGSQALKAKVRCAHRLSFQAATIAPMAASIAVRSSGVRGR